MKGSAKVVLVTIVLAVAAFLTEPNGPLGSFWRPDAAVPAATGAQVPLFMVLGACEALAFGFGVSFLLFGYSQLKALAGTGGSTRLAHLAISWLLVNWWAHDSLHLHNGMNLNGLLGIEYGFHITLIASGVVLAWFFGELVRAQA